MVPLTDAYALNGVARYGLNYGPLRLWGSAAFVVGALACGLLVRPDRGAPSDLGDRGDGGARRARRASALQPLDSPSAPAARTSGRHARCCAIPAFSPSSSPSALIQGSHAAYYTFASIAWQQRGPRRADHRRAVGARRAGRDRGVRAVAALHAVACDAGGDRARCAPCVRWIDHRAGAAARGAGRGATGARPDVRADHGRHHGPDGAPRARPHHGAARRAILPPARAS